MKKGKKPVRAQRQVSLPPDLHERMQKVEDVNWSEIAATAFAAKLNELKLRKADRMSSVIERLRRSRVTHESEEHQSGAACGAQWAKESAAFTDLQTLDRIRSELGSGWRDELFAGDSAYSPGEQFVMSLVSDDVFDRTISAEFWEGFAGTDHPTEKLVIGFIDGALDVWDAVKDQV